jgi:choline dehydrogenase-like flavoprotein
VGGFIIHEAGTCRMGADPKNSVLDGWSRAHEVKNLMVADAGPFNGNPDKNVTLTIVANSWRASERLADDMKKGNV